MSELKNKTTEKRVKRYLTWREIALCVMALKDLSLKNPNDGAEFQSTIYNIKNCVRLPKKSTFKKHKKY